MLTERKTAILENIPVTRSLIDLLYCEGKITSKEAKSLLSLIVPEKKWGAWASYLLLLIGVTQILAGIIFFFAFNWASLQPIVKLSMLQLAIVTCLFTSYYYSLEKLVGKIFLLAGSILVGIFLAVFGQIYQTGADSYQLFMLWSLLILGWTLLSKFAAQWILFLLIVNLFLVLWWDQAAQYTNETELYIYSYLLLLNGIALVLYEFFATKKNCIWLQQRWIRILLSLVVLSTLFISLSAWIFTYELKSIRFDSLLGFIAYLAIYFFYRYIQQDIWVVAMSLVFACILMLLYILNAFVLYLNLSLGVVFFCGLFVLGAFSCIIIYIKSILPEFEVRHD